MNKLIAIALTFLVIPHASRILTLDQLKQNQSNASDIQILNPAKTSTRSPLSHQTSSNNSYLSAQKTKASLIRKDIESSRSNVSGNQTQNLSNSQSNRSHMKVVQSMETQSQRLNTSGAYRSNPTLSNQTKSLSQQSSSAKSSQHIVSIHSNQMTHMPNKENDSHILLHNVVGQSNRSEGNKSLTQESTVVKDVDEDHEFVKLLKGEGQEDSDEDLEAATRAFFDTYVENPIILSQFVKFGIDEVIEMKKATIVLPKDDEQIEFEEQNIDVIEKCRGQLATIANGERQVMSSDDFGTLYFPTENVTGVMVKEINVGAQSEEEIRKEILISMLFQNSPHVVRAFKSCFLDRTDEDSQLTTRSYYLFMESCPTSLNEWLSDNKNEENNAEWMVRQVFRPMTLGLRQVHEGEIYHIRNITDSFRICENVIKIFNFEFARQMFSLKDQEQKTIWQNFESNEFYKLLTALINDAGIKDEKLQAVIDILKQDNLEAKNDTNPFENFTEELYPLYLSESENQVIGDNENNSRIKGTSVNAVFSGIVTLLLALI